MQLAFKWMVEEVASMSVAHRKQISELLGGEPVLLHAADFGWMHRPRIYWGIDVPALCALLKPIPYVDIIPPGIAADGICVVRWTGPPQPPHWAPQDGYEWTFRDEVGVKAMPVSGADFAPSYPNGRFLTLTTA